MFTPHNMVRAKTTSRHESEGAIMFCSHCGASLRSGVKFCPQCGTLVARPKPAAPATNTTASMPAAINEPTATMPQPAEARTEAIEIPATEPTPTAATPATPAQDASDTVASSPLSNAQPAAAQPEVPQPTVMTQPAMPQPDMPQFSAPQASTPASPSQPSATPTQPSLQQPPTVVPPTTVPPTVVPPTATAPNPVVQKLMSPNSIRAMAASTGIGIGAAIAVALLSSILLMIAGSSALRQLSYALSMLGSGNSGASAVGPNFFQWAVFILIMGVSGSFSVSSTVSGASIDQLGISSYLWFPINLSGLALVLGAAFGAHLLARRRIAGTKWSRIASAAIVGFVTSLIYLLLGAMFKLPASASLLDTTGRAVLHGTSLRTFAMAFLLSALGAAAGFTLADLLPDESNPLQATWTWLHRAHGFVRTCAESMMVYAVVFTVLSVIGFAAWSIHMQAAQLLLLLPLLLPALPLTLFTLSSFAVLEMTANDQAYRTLSLFNITSTVDFGWILWLCFAAFLISTFYIVLRASTRAMYDRTDATWNASWKAPLCVGLFWLVGEYLFVNLSGGFNTGTVGRLLGGSEDNSSFSLAPQPWYFLVAALWAFGIEVIALTIGSTLVSSLVGSVPGLWRFLVAGTVQASPAATPEASPTTTPAPVMQAPTLQGSFPQTMPQAMPQTMPQTTNGQSAMNAGTPVTMPAPPAMTQPADPAQRRRVITITAIVGACILLGIVYGVVNSTVFSAKSVANSYLSSIAAGRFSEATNLADPHLNGNKAALLTDKAAGGANTTIYNQRITSSARQPDGSTQLGISYMLGTRTYTSTLTMTPSGSKFLLFRNWHINTPLLTTMSLQVPQAAGTVNINGVPVSVKGAASHSGNDNSSSTDESDATLELNAYPGVYTAKLAQSDYLTASPVVITNANGISSESASQSLDVRPTHKLTTAIQDAVRKKLDTCAASTSANPQGCPFSNSGYSSFSTSMSDDYRNFAWSIASYPTVQNVDVSAKSFETTSGNAKVTYDEKSGDDWSPESDSNSFTVNGTFSIVNNQVKVTFSDESTGLGY
ncbi:heme utilization protein [Bifidobacterium mongoliense DSM 21395]|uniref:Heme utilization protein n=2 Tax=Bifidobacterium mongoliense TaxID=518643 RepID=A0A087BZZ0_9BIFI|nr:heme utilization protein [Bifidobacterium mongoliense DSM 21395]